MRNNFELKVLIYRRPDMMDESLEYELYMGINELRNMFKDEIVDEKKTELFFSFPERWLNVIQERSLYMRIQKFYPNVKKVTIKTHSVYIIQTTRQDECLIVDEGGPLMQECATGPTSYPPPMNVVNAKGLTIL